MIVIGVGVGDENDGGVVIVIVIVILEKGTLLAFVSLTSVQNPLYHSVLLHETRWW
ncbi:hypothetical protein M0804_014481 [Polistes exclamans]|nr:hypothetical protein M0804_014483 [Polistes exclamans]KAI4475155.1 hypothetical protein M0804_014481 [Polistes exclamans]